MTDPATKPVAPADRRRPWLVAGLLAGGLAVVAAALILLGPTPPRIAYDQNGFHLPTIRGFAAQWPAPELRDYLSATTPGYHLALAGASKLVGESVTALRLVGLVFSVGLAGTLGWALGRLAPWPVALACGVPVLCSLYVLGPAAWLLPDNASLWAVLGVALVAARFTDHRRADALGLLALTLLLLAAVLTRQMHVWVAAVALTGAWLAGRRGDDPTTPALLSPADARALLQRPLPRLVPVALVLLAALPAAGVLLAFVKLWGGLTPAGAMIPDPPADLEGPANFARVRGGNPATPALVLSLWAIYGVFFGGFLLRPLADLWRRARWVIFAAAAGGAALALVPETAPSADAGRWTGLWQIAAKLPVVGTASGGGGTGRTSLLLVALAPLGAVLVAAAAHGLNARHRWLLLAALAAFTAAQTASFLSWQRYLEPCLLVLMALAAASIAGAAPDQAQPPRAARLGPLALAGLLLAVSAMTIFGR